MAGIDPVAQDEEDLGECLGTCHRRDREAMCESERFDPACQLLEGRRAWMKHQLRGRRHGRRLHEESIPSPAGPRPWPPTHFHILLPSWQGRGVTRLTN